MKQYVTITTKPGVLKVGETVTLVKERENKFDNEAIAVMAQDPAGGLRPEGYVSAFYKTRKPDTISAGRIYDKFKDIIDAIVVDEGVVEVDLL